MNNANHSDGDRIAPELAPPANAGLIAENEQLRQRVRKLEDENARYRQTLAAVEAERDHWRKETYAWVQKVMEREDPLDEEKLRGQIEEESWLPLEAFIDEIEGTGRGS
jgi:hypothetical protein